MIEKEIFLKKIQKIITADKIKFTKELDTYYVSTEEFPRTLGQGSSEKEAMENLFEELWENFVFLFKNRNQLGDKPKKDLKYFMEVLGIKIVPNKELDEK